MALEQGCWNGTWNVKSDMDIFLSDNMDVVIFWILCSYGFGDFYYMASHTILLILVKVVETKG